MNTIIKHVRIASIFFFSLFHLDQTSQFFKKKREKSRIEKTSKASKNQNEQSRKLDQGLKKKKKMSRKRDKATQKKNEKFRKCDKTSKKKKISSNRFSSRIKFEFRSQDRSNYEKHKNDSTT